ncbi:hypothetical protein ACXWR7_12585, partial [Streptococcus pyogenes]
PAAFPLFAAPPVHAILTPPGLDPLPPLSLPSPSPPFLSFLFLPSPSPFPLFFPPLLPSFPSSFPLLPLSPSPLFFSSFPS